eukprot:Plantae.Rhodophyta-Purpureofilum_apyrenoidigerum.ctg20454.p1 GENE.Plantae.Rhodophyta-Purpureofilum_apyrenoidigerum.ctg20454~~Plantae.Rhodophyta-Purpureofilum_apyrenoidigerum.ctg20454.p1  ORF type:complete len:180 (+),score=46.36 Plantae.Rhodophyta-Purpureofilum_apyrenoidigerum.ctg20454:90-629(+)
MADVADPEEGTPLINEERPPAPPRKEDDDEDEGDEDVTAEGKKKDKKRKKDKKEKTKKRRDDDIKTHMSNERTFFKWLFFGFHIGGFGTFILTFFTPGGGRIYVVLFIWLIAFFFMYYGLFRYFTRRRAMTRGLRSPDEWDDPVAPALMAAALFLIVGAIITYAVLTRQVPDKKGWEHH